MQLLGNGANPLKDSYVGCEQKVPGSLRQRVLWSFHPLPATTLPDYVPLPIHPPTGVTLPKCIRPCQLASWQNHTPVTLPTVCTACTFHLTTWGSRAGTGVDGGTSFICPMSSRIDTGPSLIQRNMFKHPIWLFKKYFCHSYKSIGGNVVLFEYFFLMLSVLLKLKYSSEN